MTGDTVPDDRRYTKSHEWVKTEGDEWVIGITDHAQSELTDIVFVELPADGKSVAPGAGVLVLESVKTVADVYAPTAGVVARSNGDLKAHPEYVNQDPYGKGWLYRFKPTGSADLGHLLTAEQYRALVASDSSTH